MPARQLPAFDELAAMSLHEVENRATELPRWPRRGFMDWLMERGPEWGTDEAEGDLWRRLAKRMRQKRAARVGDLGREVTEDWHPRLVTMYELRRDA